MDDIDKLLANLDNTVPTPPVKASTPVTGSLDALLCQIKTEQTIQNQAEELKQQQLIQEQQQQQQLNQKLKQQRQQELKNRQRQELHHAAEQWLKTLKPKSDEARWFEEFACNYESRLEAAIEYLVALQEVNHTVPRS